MKTPLLLLGAVLGASLRADTAATLLGDRIAAMGSDQPVLLVSDSAVADGVATEAGEIARLEKLPAVAIPIQDETLAGTITTIASTCGMNFIAPSPDDFPERITLTTKVNPWRLLHRLGDRYRFSMAYREGIWEFNRDAAGAVIAKVYSLKHTNLDVYRTSQNAFSTVAGASASGTGESGAGSEGGMVFSAETQKIIDDIRQLIGLRGATLASSKPNAAEPRHAPAGVGEPVSSAAGSPSNVIYLPDANALYVTCTRQQHEIVAGYIELLDQRPRQVCIEARFFETSWDPKAVLGINPQALQPKVSLEGMQSNLDLSRMSGDSLRAVLTVDDVAVQLNALRSDRRSRLVQNPTVVTANNREVYFSVGDEEPFVSSNSVYPGAVNGGFGSSTASVSIRRIGTSVNIVPTVFDGAAGEKRRIRLVVRIEVGALKDFRQINGISVPVVTSQKYEYTTYVEEDQVLAFGGLAGIGEVEGVTKVPLAGDVPVVGYLFKSRSRELHQRNLVAYIVARVVDEASPVAMPELPLRDAAAQANTRGSVFPQ